MKKVIITGSTGMIGKGVLLECLDSPNIEEVLIINRSSIGIKHPKLQEVLLKDFLQIETIKDQLKGYDACFYCMGISAVGMGEEAYTKITYTTTKAFADLLFGLNPEMVFVYISGAGTNSSEKGGAMWTRVKGRTENMVLKTGFKDAYAFRPGGIISERGIKSRTSWYNAMYFITRPLFPLFKRSKNITTTTKLGQSMINTLFYPRSQKVLEAPAINELAAKHTN